MAAIVRQAGQAVAPALERSQVETDQGILDLFEMPNFLAQVSTALLFGGWPDLESLRPKFAELFPKTPWEELEQPLNIFYYHLQSQLRQDEVWKDILGQFQLEAKLNKLDATTLHIAELAQETVDASKRTANASERTAGHLEGKAQRQREHLNALERRYLRNVFAECNGLPLAGDAPPDANEKHRRRPRLQRVYVDLYVRQQPTVGRVLDRLGVSGAQREQVSRLLSQGMEGEGAARLAGAPAAVKDRRGTGAGGAVAEDDVIAEGLAHSLLQNSERREQLEKLGYKADAVTAALQPVTVFEALRDYGQLVLLGNPGSGKSTLTRRLAGTLAAGQSDPGEVEWLEAEDTRWQERLPDAFDHWLLPVRIVLSRWAAYLPESSEGAASDLIAECRRILRKTVGESAIQDLDKRFTARLTGKKPSVLVLLLDGLDEVSDGGQRAKVLAAVRDSAAATATCPCWSPAASGPTRTKARPTS